METQRVEAVRVSVSEALRSGREVAAEGLCAQHVWSLWAPSWLKVRHSDLAI